MLRVRLAEPTFLAVGAAFGTSKAGIGIAGLGQFKPELIMKVRYPPRAIFYRVYLLTNNCGAQSLIPVVMSGIIAVYGLVVSVLIVGRRKWFSASRYVIPLRLVQFFFDTGT
jgi:V-type H+-transporting ATPase proteolipid subunit